MGSAITKRRFLCIAASLVYPRSSNLLAGTPQPIASAASPAGYLNAQDFGVVADAGEDGSGTDNQIPLQAFFNALAEGTVSEAVIPPGRYAVSGPISLLSDRLRNLSLHAMNVELVFTTSTPQRGRAYVALGNRSGRGSKLSIEGLTARLCRPAVRTSNSDMLRLKGFREYQVQGVTIPSSDNMGLVIGRGDPLGWTPDSIVVTECSVGGRREDMPHSHGSIGDTAIWIVSPARQTRVERCRIRETGDDGIYIGHSNSKLIERVVIKDNSLADTTVGIGVSVGRAEIDGNRIDRTSCFAIRCEYQNGGDGSDAQIRNNSIVRAGQLEAGEIGERMIPKSHPHAIFIHQPGGRILIEDNIIDSPRECGVVLLTHREGPLDDVRLRGGTFRKIGADARGGQSSYNQSISVFRRSGSGPETCSNFSAVGCRIENVNQSMLSWIASGKDDDRNISVQNATLVDCNLGNNPLVRLGSQGMAQIREVNVEWIGERSNVRRPFEVSPLLDLSTVSINQKKSP